MLQPGLGGGETALPAGPGALGAEHQDQIGWAPRAGTRAEEGAGVAQKTSNGEPRPGGN